jgi:type II secretory pathway pseudopilin PulG
MKLSKKGFTLLEILFTCGIILLVVVGLLTTFVYCFLLNQTNHNLVIALNDAQYVLEQVKNLAYNDIAGYSPPVFSNLADENVDITASVGSKIAELTVNVSWTERSNSKNVSLSTRIAR